MLPNKGIGLITLKRFVRITKLKKAHFINIQKVCTFSLVTFWEECGKSTQMPSSLIWHNAAVAVIGQAGSHNRVSSSGSKVIPNHSSSTPAGEWSHRILDGYDTLSAFKCYSTRWQFCHLFEWTMGLTVFERADLDSWGVHHRWPALWWIYQWLLKVFCGIYGRNSNRD